MKMIITILALVILGGCGISDVQVSKENYNKIQNGMSYDQIHEIMGSPSSKSESQTEGLGKMETWWYQFGGTAIVIEFLNGKVYGKNWVQ